MAAGGKPRVLVVGAGALGTVYGAALARAGAEVELLGRRAHAEAIARAGRVSVEEPDGRWEAPLAAEWRPDRVRPADIVIVLTKAHDTEEALAGIAHVRDGVRTAVSLQNGVEKDAVLGAWCGAERVLGGTSMVGATLEEPGSVRHTLPGLTYLGPLDGRGDARNARELAGLLEAGGLPARVTDRIRSAEWCKLMHAAPSMTMTALARMPFHAALQDRGLSALYVAIVREGAAIAAAAGVELDDWPGMFPVRTIAHLPRRDAVALVRERGREMGAGRGTDVRISMLRDIELGRRLELDAVHGFLAREAERLGVDAPLIRSSYLLLRALDTSGEAT